MQSGLPLIWDDDVPVARADSGKRSGYRVAKRIFDVVLSLLVIAVLAPLMLIVAIAVKATSAGPVFFRQRRVGVDDSQFDLFKFRTMYEGRGDPSGVDQTRERDDRVTALGAWLRRTSLDELPQLFNILKGEMSFVGPRPHVPGQLAAGLPYATVVPYYALRHRVLPGLTGWAQANGFRGPTSDADRARARIDYDLAYVQNASLLLDLKIIAMTAKQEFLTGSGW